VSRPYRSVRRVEQAAGTRRLILDAARRVFGEHGYSATTLAAIAEAAHVAVPTLYASVGGKPALLAALQERMDEDSDAAAALLAIRDATDPVMVLRTVIGVPRRMNEQFGDVLAVWFAAAASEPDVARAVAEGMRRHRAGMELAAIRLGELQALRVGVSVQDAAETLGVLTAPGVWQAMVGDYRWTWDAAADWVEALARSSILAR
jgi:AcrR family transcriptional regulator